MTDEEDFQLAWPHGGDESDRTSRRAEGRHVAADGPDRSAAELSILMKALIGELVATRTEVESLRTAIDAQTEALKETNARRLRVSVRRDPQA